MGVILFFLFFILVLAEVVWYATCTKHKDIPLILVIIDALTGFFPVLNIFMFFINLLLLYFLIEDKSVKLKDNWFNRKFLAYHAE